MRRGASGKRGEFNAEFKKPANTDSPRKSDAPANGGESQGSDKFAAGGSFGNKLRYPDEGAICGSYDEGVGTRICVDPWLLQLGEEKKTSCVIRTNAPLVDPMMRGSVQGFV